MPDGSLTITAGIARRGGIMKQYFRQIRSRFKKSAILFLTAFVVVSVLPALLAVRNPVFAEAYPGIAAKIKGHWSEKYLKPQIIELYLPQYAVESFAKFEPSAFMAQSAAYHALKAMYKEYGLRALNARDDINKVLKRRDILVLLAPISEKHTSEIIPEGKFEDINHLTSEEQKNLAILEHLGILKGVSAKHFAPDRDMTQSEVVIVLQRVYDLVANPFADVLPKKMEKLTFVTSDYVRSYDSAEGTAFSEDESSLYITVTKRFPTPSYTLHIMQIYASEQGFHVDLKTKGLLDGAMVPQVITYESITVQIPKSDIPKNTPHKVLGVGVTEENLKNQGVDR